MRPARFALAFGALALAASTAASSHDPRDDVRSLSVPGAPGAPNVTGAPGAPGAFGAVAADALSTSDCSLEATVPSPRWGLRGLLHLPVVVHVIADAACANGNLSDEAVVSQIAILNEDYRALVGTPGGAGADTQIAFYLADRDPQGNPTSGITRHCNATWYADQGEYWQTLAWNPARYINIYTNNAGGSRGYVPFLPADPAGAIGLPQDRVVINWLAFGRNGPVPAHATGRTATHEVGHFLGLFHTYFEGCGLADEPDCYTSGDRLCDTPPNASNHSGCPTNAVGCGGVPAPISNYMELTDDTCMTGFTAEQAQRMRCTLGTYRTALARSPIVSKGDPPP